MILKDIHLIGSRLEELFRFMRQNTSLDNFALEGCLCEYKDDMQFEQHKDPGENQLHLIPRESSVKAKRRLADFVTKKSDRYPFYMLRNGYTSLI
jgi:hypothetical protein